MKPRAKVALKSAAPLGDDGAWRALASAVVAFAVVNAVGAALMAPERNRIEAVACRVALLLLGLAVQKILFAARLFPGPDTRRAMSAERETAIVLGAGFRDNPAILSVLRRLGGGLLLRGMTALAIVAAVVAAAYAEVGGGLVGRAGVFGTGAALLLAMCMTPRHFFSPVVLGAASLAWATFAERAVRDEWTLVATLLLGAELLTFAWLRSGWEEAAQFRDHGRNAWLQPIIGSWRVAVVTFLAVALGTYWVLPKTPAEVTSRASKGRSAARWLERLGARGEGSGGGGGAGGGGSRGGAGSAPGELGAGGGGEAGDGSDGSDGRAPGSRVKSSGKGKSAGRSGNNARGVSAAYGGVNASYGDDGKAGGGGSGGGRPGGQGKAGSGGLVGGEDVKAGSDGIQADASGGAEESGSGVSPAAADGSNGKSGSGGDHSGAGGGGGKSGSGADHFEGGGGDGKSGSAGGHSAVGGGGMSAGCIRGFFVAVAISFFIAFARECFGGTAADGGTFTTANGCDTRLSTDVAADCINVGVSGSSYHATGGGVAATSGFALAGSRCGVGGSAS